MKKWDTVGAHDVNTKMNLLTERKAFCPDLAEWRTKLQGDAERWQRELYTIIIQHWPDDYKTVLVDKYGREVSDIFLEPIMLDGESLLTFEGFFDMVRNAKDEAYDTAAIASFLKDMTGEKLELLKLMLRLE